MDLTPGSILHETLDEVRRAGAAWPAPPKVERVVVGLFFTGVKLDTGHAGVCYTPAKSVPEAVCCPSSALALPAPGRFRGRDALELAAEGLVRGKPLQKAVAIAALNALSAACFALGEAPGTDLRAGLDPIDAFGLADSDRVVVVGALVPYLRMLKARGVPFHVLEQDPATLKADELPYYVPAERAAEVVPGADVLVLTGTTLLTDTLEQLLGMAKSGARTMVVGPTASMLPGALFARSVEAVAGIRVTRPDALLDVLAEGGSGHHFFGVSAQKVARFHHP
jgi:uncharacterized protein